MNLKTKGSPAKDRAHHGSTDDFIHDAAAAHALMRAMENRMQRAQDNHHLREELTLGGIFRYADELMREWGFES